jgi:hippurate hydrolase
MGTATVFCGVLRIAGVLAGIPDVLAPIDEIHADLETLYKDLHASPEVSLHEERTAAKLAERLRGLGFEVTSGVGGHGIVGVLRNGEGPTVMLRTDLDALPVQEQTGLPYASRLTARDETGATIHVMHACGHDLHMAAWIGAATLLSRARERWRGTIVMVGQPAEEQGVGARAMLDDGLFSRFPRPHAALAIHNHAELPAGAVGYAPGYALASVDSVDITVHGVGGHGAYPHTAVDPIVIAARTIVALQTVVARENNPLDPAVVTVGSIHGGTKHNIIPDSVRLQLTVRSYKEEVRRRLLAAIERIARAEAAAAGAPQPPEVAVSPGTPATYNDPELTRRVATAIAGVLGDANVVQVDPVMGGEDFSEYGLAGVRAALLWVGAADPERHRRAKERGEPLPPLHSPLFAPDLRALRTAVLAETASVLELLGRP